jgi:hypothetical protein
VTSFENTGLSAVPTTVASLLPFQAPTANAYWPALRPAWSGGAM